MTIRFANDFSMTINAKAVTCAYSFDVRNPADEIVIGQAPDCGPGQLDDAVSAARSAFSLWAATPIGERRQFIRDSADAIKAHLAALRWLLTSEHGKTLAESEREIRDAIALLRETANLPFPGPEVREHPGRRSITQRLPVGVVGVITSWNSPVAQTAVKIGPALLAGNTVVVKPSPFTPLTTLKLGEILGEVLPEGVLNVISGGDELGRWMSRHDGIDKISFSGSAQAGRKVMSSAAWSLKHLTLELSANNAAIVLADVDVTAVAGELFSGAFADNGQTPFALSRIYAHQAVYEPLRDALVTHAAQVRIGDGTRADTTLGPVQNRRQYAHLIDLIADSTGEGHTFLTGGAPTAGPGYFLAPTIVDNPPGHARKSVGRCSRCCDSTTSMMRWNAQTTATTALSPPSGQETMSGPLPSLRASTWVLFGLMRCPNQVR
jgi:acyl-CoA reductase-like NAD-dependent aldehyde dehydrogenase